MSQVISTRQVMVEGKDSPVTINDSDFNPEVHTVIEGKEGKPRRVLLADSTRVGSGAGTLDAAAMKELGPKKTKEEKDALDNAKVVKDRDKILKGGAATAVGPGAQVEHAPHKPSPRKDERLVEEIAPGASGSATSVVGDADKQRQIKGLKDKEDATKAESSEDKSGNATRTSSGGTRAHLNE